MRTLRIPLTPIALARDCDRALLEKTELVAEEEKAAFTKEDWGYYAKGWYDSWLLPEIAPARYFYAEERPVVPLAGSRFRVHVAYDDWDAPYDAEGKRLVLEETADPETAPDREAPPRGCCGGHRVQVFGQPNWIQNPHFPAGPDGAPCRHLITMENGWGDSGNWNVLVHLGEDGLPSVAYFEASCC